jgi:phosphoribosylamine--glycine ligase
MKVLVVGSGGREHSLCWKIAQSPLVKKVYAAPGNAGTASIAKNVDIGAANVPELLRFAKNEGIGLTVVGPEQPLVNGIVDAFAEEKLRAFGPSKSAAALEGSKSFCKQILRKHGIPTASFRVFDNPRAAIQYVKNIPYPAVIKADGLAAGKGVVIANSEDEAVTAVRQMMDERVFGPAGDKIVVEECLTGQEASIMAITDGKDIALLETVQDHKKIYEGEIGPNTGGMGTYSPMSSLNHAEFKKVISKVLVPIVHAMRKEGMPFKGVLYAGMMFTKAGPKVLEFNVRFGDPECQVLMMRMKSDLVPIMEATIDEKLESLEGHQIAWSERSAVCVVMASGGYPGSYETGYEIDGLDDASKMNDVVVFHAGTALKAGKVVTSGGRVLGVTAMGDTIRQAREQAYEAVKKVTFKNSYCRADIARGAGNPSPVDRSVR